MGVYVIYNLRDYWPAVRGSAKFTDKAHLNSNASSKEVQKERDVVQAETILKVVSVCFECNGEELLKAKRGGGVDNTARAMAMTLCQELGSMKLAEMGKLFGIGSDSGVTKTISRFTQRLSEDDELRGVFNVICQDLTPQNV